MFSFLRQTVQEPKIRVLIVPTSTYNACSHGCSLSRLQKNLNDAQSCYDFSVVGGSLDGDASPDYASSFVLARTQPLQFSMVRAAAPKSQTEKDRSVSTYIGIDDASDQIVSHTSQCLSFKGEAPLSVNDIIIGIGGEVVVHDVFDNEFEGGAELDAYSTISRIKDVLYYPGIRTDEGTEVNFINDLSDVADNVAFISLRRVSTIFPEIYFSDVPERVRAIVGRYLVCNIGGFVGNKTFAIGVSHDDMSGCLNESNWVGGERLSYKIDSYCPKCRESYHKYGMAEKYAGMNYWKVIESVTLICQLAKAFDKVVEFDERAELWKNIGLVAVSLNLLDSFIFDMSYNLLKEPLELEGVIIPPHVPAVVIAIIVALFGAYSIKKFANFKKTLP